MPIVVATAAVAAAIAAMAGISNLFSAAGKSLPFGSGPGSGSGVADSVRRQFVT
jgi:hypothetical protein